MSASRAAENGPKELRLLRALGDVEAMLAKIPTADVRWLLGYAAACHGVDPAEVGMTFLQKHLGCAHARATLASLSEVDDA